MNYFERILCWLQGEMTEPGAFGWFHWLWLILTVGAIIVLYERNRKYPQKDLKNVLGVYGVIALVLEFLKQLIWSFNYDEVTQVVMWDYQWYAFPFQLCTTPIFVTLICLFLKKGKVRDTLLSYMGYVTILGSISTMLIPSSCFVSDILVNIHTMWLHLGSFVVSIYLFISGEVKIDLESLKRAIKVFFIFGGIALFLNVVVYNMGILKGETFNMFYISPYFISSLPVFNVIQENVNYIVFLLTYIWAIIIGALIIYGVAKGVQKLVICGEKKKADHTVK